MAKKKNREMVVFDPLSKKIYKLVDGILEETSSNYVEDFSYNVTYMPGNKVMYSSIEIPSDSEDDELSIVTNKTYENLGLDIEKDYKISYGLSNVSQGIDSVYNVFVVENEQIDSEFSDLANKIKYIDYIDMEPLLYQTLYSNNIVEPVGVQIFIHFHNDYGSFCIYKDGELIGYRIIEKLGIKFLHSEHCNNLAERIQEQLFLKDLEKFGFDHENTEYKLSLNKALLNSLMLLSNNLKLMLRNAQADLSVVDKVFVGSDCGKSESFLDKIKVMFNILKDKEYDNFYEYLLYNNTEPSENTMAVKEYVNIHKMDYNIFINIRRFMKNITPSVENGVQTETKGEIAINPFVLLCFLRAREQLREQNDIFNISAFLRPPPFAKRHSGKLILSILFSVVLASFYPLYNFAYASFIDFKIGGIKTEVSDKKIIYDNIKREISSLESQISKLKEELGYLKTQLQTRHVLLNNIYDKKVNYLNKTNTIIEISKLLNDNGIKITNMDIVDNNIVLNLKGLAKNITDFLIAIGENSRYKIDSRELLIEDLSKQSNHKEYLSKIKIRVKR